MEINFSPDEPFVVKNSKGILIFIMLFSLLIFISAVTVNDGSSLASKFIFAVPGIACLVGLIFDQPLIIVNKEGIWASGKMITDWKHFSGADFKEKQVAGSYSDHFYLRIEYSKPGIEGYFLSTVPLSDTQNCSEEAVLAAIDFFYQNYKSLARGTV